MSATTEINITDLLAIREQLETIGNLAVASASDPKQKDDERVTDIVTKAGDLIAVIDSIPFNVRPFDQSAA